MKMSPKVRNNLILFGVIFCIVMLAEYVTDRFDLHKMDTEQATVTWSLEYHNLDTSMEYRAEYEVHAVDMNGDTVVLEQQEDLLCPESANGRTVITFYDIPPDYEQKYRKITFLMSVYDEEQHVASETDTFYEQAEE